MISGGERSSLIGTINVPVTVSDDVPDVFDAVTL